MEMIIAKLDAEYAAAKGELQADFRQQLEREKQLARDTLAEMRAELQRQISQQDMNMLQLQTELEDGATIQVG